MCPIWSLLLWKQQLSGGSKVDFKMYDLVQHQKCVHRCIMCVNDWIWLTSHSLSIRQAERSDNHVNALSSTPLTSLFPSLVRFLTTASASVRVSARVAFKVVIHDFFLPLFKALRSNYWGISATHFPNLSLTKCAQFLLKSSTLCLRHPPSLQSCCLSTLVLTASCLVCVLQTKVKPWKVKLFERWMF